MKGKELIRQLQEADPTGEIEVCIGNADVWDVTVLPAYYDGALHVIERDAENRPMRGRRVRSGEKVSLGSISIEDCADYDDFTIEYATEADRQRYEKCDLERKRRDHEINFTVEMEFFADWVFLKIQAIKPIPLGWVDRIKAAAEEFYRKHRGPDVDGKAIKSREWPNSSYADKLHEIWDETVIVNWDEYSRITMELVPAWERITTKRAVHP